MTTRAYCFRCLVAALVLCLSTSCDRRLLRSVLSGFTCSPPQDVPHANTAKTKRLDHDLFVLFNRGITGYIDPTFSGRLVLEARDKTTGYELDYGDPNYYVLTLGPVPLPAASRYYVRFPLGACGDGRVDSEYKLWLDQTGKRTLMFNSSTSTSAADELVRQFDWDDLLD